MSNEVPKKDTIKFTDYDVLGFDMDFTLARYELVPFFNLTYGCLCKFLVSKKNYDASIFHGLQENKELVYSGLIADCERGNILKLGKNGTIIRASHGTRRMSENEITATYGPQKLFPYYDEFINGIRNPDKKWRFFDNYFDIPGVVAFAQIIDHLEGKKEAVQSSFAQAYIDVSEGFEEMYIPTQFAKERGGYFSSIKANTSKYIDRISSEVKVWLKNLRKDGRKMFLLTSSFTDYSDLIMKTVFGEEWKSYFDICLYGARKPKFFTETGPFIRMAGAQPMGEVRELEDGKEYCHGNMKDLMTYLQKITGKDDPKVLYFGDNLFADAWPCTSKAGWDSVLILEEMDAEGYAVTDGTVPGHDEDETQDPSSSQPSKKRKFEHSSLVTEEEIQLMVSKFWGSHFTDDGTDSPVSTVADDRGKCMDTCYGILISKFATICVPSIEYLSGVPVDHEFRTFSSTPGNTRGFHPGQPRSLLPS